MKSTTNYRVTKIAIAATSLGFSSMALAVPPPQGTVPETGSTLGMLALAVIGLGLANSVFKKFKK